MGQIFDLFENDTKSVLLGLMSSHERNSRRISRVTSYEAELDLESLVAPSPKKSMPP